MALTSLWVKVSTQLPRHPKTIYAASKLGITQAELIGRLCMLWIYCAEFRPSGYIAEPEELARAMEWTGDPLKLTEALSQIPCFNGFIDTASDISCGFYVHDWEVFNNGAALNTEKRREKNKKEDFPRDTREKTNNENMNSIKREIPEEVKEKLQALLLKAKNKTLADK